MMIDYRKLVQACHPSFTENGPLTKILPKHIMNYRKNLMLCRKKKRFPTAESRIWNAR